MASHEKLDLSSLPDANTTITENELQEIRHAVFKHRLRTICTPHVDSADGRPINQVLDLGCGNGIWTRDFAATHSDCKVLGVDLDPPDADRASDCVSLVKGDVQRDWEVFLPEGTPQFDFIFARMLVTVITDWKAVFERASTHMRPGGLFESHEMALDLFNGKELDASNSQAMALWEKITTDLKSRGIPDSSAPHRHAALLDEAGFSLLELRVERVLLCNSADATEEDRKMTALLLKDSQALFAALAERMADVDSAAVLAAQRELADPQLGFQWLHYHCVSRKNPD